MSMPSSTSPHLSMLHRAILLDPGDDLARLAYADALEESGQDASRAEFIRVQVEMAHKHTCGCAPSLFVVPDCETCRLVEPIRRRQRDLFDRHGTDWLADFYGPFAGIDAKMRRGFVASVRCTLEGWMSHGAALVASHPIESVSISGKKPHHGISFEWWLLQGIEDGSDIPADIFCLLDGDKKTLGDWEWREYASEADALSALSLACLNLWRPACGLPLLTMGEKVEAVEAGR